MPSSKKTTEFALVPDRRSLVGAFQEPAGSFGKKLLDLKFLIMHYTAGRSFNSTVAHFKDPASKASAHLVVGRDGKVVQMVPFDRPAWHAGADSQWMVIPSWKGSWKEADLEASKPITYKRMNFYSLGIEFENYGPLRRAGDNIDDDFVTWFGGSVESSDVVEVDPKARGSFGVKYWHRYTRMQIEAAEKLAKLLVREFNLVDILGHSDVAPRRKTDPGPLFPMKHIKSLVFGRADEEVCSCERPDVKAGLCTVCGSPAAEPAP